MEKLPAAHCAQSTPVMVKYPAGQDVQFEAPGLDTAPECIDKVYCLIDGFVVNMCQGWGDWDWKINVELTY